MASPNNDSLRFTNDGQSHADGQAAVTDATWNRQPEFGTPFTSPISLSNETSRMNLMEMSTQNETRPSESMPTTDPTAMELDNQPVELLVFTFVHVESNRSVGSKQEKPKNGEPRRSKPPPR
jgi:hypothetical protein